MSTWPISDGWIGLDVGGANLKIAGPQGLAEQRSLAVWKQHRELSSHIGQLLSLAPSRLGIALTMTAELADCFASKRDGVLTVLDAVRDASPGSRLLVYSTSDGGTFVDEERARLQPTRIAAANWLALAHWAAARWRVSNGLMVDTGSTTTDIVRLAGYRACSRGFNDSQRLATGELVYTGLLRTPVAAIAPRLPYGGNQLRSAAEWFALSADAHVVLGSLPEGETYETPDGRPADIPHAKARLARCLCLDADDLSEAQAELLAGDIVRQQRRAIEDGLAQVASASAARIDQVVVSGAGWRMAQQAVQNVLPRASVTSVADCLGEAASRCAAAIAVAAMASTFEG